MLTVSHQRLRRCCTHPTAGYSREHIIGVPLASLLAPAAPGVAPPAWSALQLEAERGCRFLVPSMVALAPEVSRDGRKGARVGCQCKHAEGRGRTD